MTQYIKGFFKEEEEIFDKMSPLEKKVYEASRKVEFFIDNFDFFKDKEYKDLSVDEICSKYGAEMIYFRPWDKSELKIYRSRKYLEICCSVIDINISTPLIDFIVRMLKVIDLKKGYVDLADIVRLKLFINKKYNIDEE